MTDIFRHAIRHYNPSRSKLVVYNRDSIQLPEGVSYEFDVDAVIEKFKMAPERSDGELRIPLHRRESPELSGEHVELKESSIGDYLIYNQPSRGKSRQSVRNLSETRIAERLRFWSDEYEPDSDPSYLKERSTTVPEGEVLRADPSTKHSKSESWFDELTDFVDTLEAQERSENREAYQRQSFSRYSREHGGLFEVVHLTRREQTDFGEVFEFSVPAEDEDDPDPLGLVDNHGLYPYAEVLIEPLGETNLSQKDIGLVRAKIVYWDDDDRMLALSVLDSISRAARQVLTDDSEVYRIAGLLNTVPYDRQRNAINSCQANSRRRNVLLGQTSLEYNSKYSLKVQKLGWKATEDADRWTRKTFYDPGGEDPVVGGIGLNEYQAAAAERALRAKHVYCIHGPPGTGKTRTLNAITRQVIAEGGKVLVCAHSNAAVDNLIVGDSTLKQVEPGTLHELVQNPSWDLDVSIARAGTGCENDVVNKHYAGVSEAKADIVATTASAADKFDSNHFDLAIIDEATQASIPASLIPYTCAQKLVLAGDHKQLPPYKSTEAEERPIHVSLFEHLLEVYDSGLSTMLQRQYRMNEEIARFPSEAFYDGELQTGERNAMWSVPNQPPLVGLNIDGEEVGAGTSKKNPREAKVVAKQVQKLHESGVPMGAIGVITAYRGQIGEVKQVLNNHVEGDTQYVTVDTVDSFQGSEREAIVVSFVRSNEEGRSGFLTLPNEGPRRLNVALTRAKKHLTLVGNFETLGRIPHYRDEDEDCSDVYAALTESLRDRQMMVEPSKLAKSD